MQENEKRPGESADEALLREIRQDYSYFRDYWQEN